jgi:hypothetical protein
LTDRFDASALSGALQTPVAYTVDPLTDPNAAPLAVDPYPVATPPDAFPTDPTPAPGGYQAPPAPGGFQGPRAPGGYPAPPAPGGFQGPPASGGFPTHPTPNTFAAQPTPAPFPAQPTSDQFAAGHYASQSASGQFTAVTTDPTGMQAATAHGTTAPSPAAAATSGTASVGIAAVPGTVGAVSSAVAVAPEASAPPAATPPTPKTLATLIVPFLVACLVAAGLGVYGKLHEPTGVAVNIAGFSSPATVKVWLATLAFVLAVFQLFTALVMYGKIQLFKDAKWLGPAHRWSGRLAFLASIPVALHCLYALGFDDYSTRVLIHSLLGCFFYGTFAAKMLILSKKGVPGWALPLFGGLVFTALSGLFVTSALWFFTTFGVKL